jgi:hypothetical protein
MPETRPLLERVMERVELRPFTLEGFHDRRDRKRRNQRIVAGVVGIAVFVPAIWIVTSVGSLDRSQTSVVPGGDVTGPAETGPAETGPTALEPVVPPPGIPPHGATPSFPETGELILSVSLMSDTPAREVLTHMYVYADGRLIWSRDGALPEGANGYYTGFVEQRLTPQGAELMRSEVTSSGLIDPHSVMVDGQDDPDPFPLLGLITVRDAGQLVGREFAYESYQTGGPHHEGETTCRPAWGCAHIATAEEERSLERLYARLTDPASWLPASAWADQEIMAFVPSRYQVCYGGKEENIERDRVLNALPGPVAELLRARDAQPQRIISDPPSPCCAPNPSTNYCSDLTTEETRVLVRALDDAGLEREQPEAEHPFDPGLVWATFRYYFPVPFVPDPIDTSARILIDPYLPHGDAICIPCSWPFSDP